MALDLLFYNTRLLTMEGDGLGYRSEAALGIKGDKIAVIGDSAEVVANYKAEKKISGEDLLLLPGLIDSHIHTEIALLRGVAQDITDWMERGLWPFSQHLDEEAKEAGTALNLLEAVRSGTTLFADFGSNLAGMVNQHKNFGTRAILAKTINELAEKQDSTPGSLYSLDRQKGEEDLQEALEWLKKDDIPATIDFFLGPQAPDMLSQELLEKVYLQAEKFNTGIHMHVAQGKREHNQMLKRYDSRTIPWLARQGLLNSSLRAVHLTEANREETITLARSGAGLIICSGSIGIIDGQVPPLQEFLEVSSKAALGSDQAPGNNCNNMFNEMKLTALFNKIKKESPLPLPAWQVLRLATIDAARCLGVEDRVGSLKAGKYADIITIDLNQASLNPVLEQPLRNLVPNLVYSARGSEVKDVLVAGQYILQDRELTNVNETEIIKRAGEAAARIINRVDLKELEKSSPLYQAQLSGNL